MTLIDKARSNEKQLVSDLSELIKNTIYLRERHHQQARTFGNGLQSEASRLDS